jgi:cell division protein FtsB
LRLELRDELKSRINHLDGPFNDKQRRKSSMRLLEKMCFVVLASGLAMGQATATNSGSALREAISQQQKQISDQQQQMSKQQQQIQTLQQQLATTTSGTPHMADASMRTVATPVSATVVQEVEKPKESPLSFRIGGTDFTPGGFVDFENIFRTTNTGNVTATNFWAIPFSNTVNGHLTEYRSTGQYSRFNLKINGKYGANNVTGYIEADFNGNDAANVFVTSNPHTMRVRLYWLDLKRGNWEFLGGQTWGLQTPNRVGVSPSPADLAITIGEDAQTHVGLNYTRAGEFRAAYHFSDQFVWAFALQNPQQFGGQGEITFPTAFNAQLGVQIDSAANAGAPNLLPDFITKFAYDPGKHFHFELGGISTSAKVSVIPTIPSGTFVKHTKLEGGVFGATNIELFKGFRFLASGMWGPGVGRYLIGMAPQVVVLPVSASGAACSSAGGCDVSISPVHSGDAIAGFEAQAGKKTLLGFYAGAMYAQRNTGLDLTKAGAPAFIGFGGPASANSNNRTVQEVTFDWTQTFWKNPQYGSVFLVNQLSYISRSPWFVPAGAPKNAHLTQVFVSLRYALP